MNEINDYFVTTLLEESSFYVTNNIMAMGRWVFCAGVLQNIALDLEQSDNTMPYAAPKTLKSLFADEIQRIRLNAFCIIRLKAVFEWWLFKLSYIFLYFNPLIGL